MRLIDADGVVEEIKRNKLLAREPATVRCMETIKNATTYAEPPRKCLVGEWIPVSERLPEYDGLYLVCLDDGYISSVEYDTDCSGTQDWELWAESGEVVAWMLLPEPYEPQIQEEKQIMNEQRCGNCIWHIHNGTDWVCTSEDSEVYGLETDYTDTCTEFLDRDN